MKSDLLRLNEISRRSFVERMAQAAFGISLLPFLPGESLRAAGITEPAATTLRGPGFGKAKAVIMLQLAGGLSQIDSFDPKTGESKGPGDAVGTKAGYQISSYFPETAKIADKITVIRSMSPSETFTPPSPMLAVCRSSKPSSARAVAPSRSVIKASPRAECLPRTLNP